jgi:hypothetical protein
LCAGAITALVVSTTVESWQVPVLSHLVLSHFTEVESTDGVAVSVEPELQLTATIEMAIAIAKNILFIMLVFLIV